MTFRCFCEKQFGDVPSQICFEWNTPQHTTDDAVPPNRRAFTKAELPHMFDVVDDFVDEQHRNGWEEGQKASSRR
jgi:integrase/recombinase XerD